MSAEIALPRTPLAASSARRHVQKTLSRWRLWGEVVDSTGLVVTELVTNTIRHGAPIGAVHLSLDLNGDRLRITVSDATPYRPLPPPKREEPDEQAPETWCESGRGLLLVTVIADAWGHQAAASDPAAGTEVWAELRTTP